jgi:hypothetical protein
LERLKSVGFAVALIIVLAPILLVWLPLYLVGFAVWGFVLRLWFWYAHIRQGRPVLFVYSNSPNWQSYVEEHLLPRLEGRAVVINWSERRLWNSTNRFEGLFFRRFTGDRHCNPIAFVSRSSLRFRVVRFHQAFLDLKHGKPATLQAAESEFWGSVERAA